jgi:hypothetical protein
MLKTLPLALVAVLLLADGLNAHGGRRVPVPTQQIVLQVCHPRTDCLLDVPVCIPACCLGAPCVRFERTLLGCGKTVFSWPCGCEVIVRYQHGGGYRVIVND